MAASKPRHRAQHITPVPSSDAIEPLSSQENRSAGMLKPVAAKTAVNSSPSRKAKKTVNYAESDSSDYEGADVFASPEPIKSPARRNRKAVLDDDDEDNYEVEGEGLVDDEDDMTAFIASDESDAPLKKRKRPKTKSAPRKRSGASPSSRSGPHRETEEEEEEADEPGPLEMPPTSTTQQWKYDPDSVRSEEKRCVAVRPQQTTGATKAKPRPHTQEPEDRRSWMASPRDKHKKAPGHPDYDPRTLYIPPGEFQKLSPFEKQYWEIKSNLMDTVVFFKKGKFYELYENDATLGHQLFDLKLTDRVNMRMVGVPESSLDIWVNQFVAKGYKVARVDQMESALGKEMRERGDKSSKPKGKDIIRRELACILTGGTLVEGSMLQDDMATYCAAIKETAADGKPPCFGIAFVDAATGHFFLSEFEDDVELTKFETFVAQISPRELVLEKSRLSAKALRILKNNTSPTTIWNHMKAGSEFWSAEMARRELECSDYFATDGVDAPPVWPPKLREAKDKEMVMSALGALVYYLRALKIDGSLVSQGNFEWYHPIHRNGTLILDGQTLINLEIFANSLDGGSEGTLFGLLNKCVTPFGKRLFRQWVCHPLGNIQKINERLDAVDMLNTERMLQDRFSAQLSKMPDLERLISRIHAGSCRAEDFVKVLDGFEQIQYTMSLLEEYREGHDGLVIKLLSSMPNLADPLAFWETAFDRQKVRDEKMLIPQKGIDEDFDKSVDELARIKKGLHSLLDRQKGVLKCKSLKFTDVGKEIYQVEAPKAIKVPSSWRQMSSTSAVKRYYFRELDELVRQLQEAEETHAQMVKEAASRFFQRFDEDYDVWLQAIRIIAQLDCLVSLARSSAALGTPSCRPEWVDAQRSRVELEELRHPCMTNAVDDFIPNDIRLGGPGHEKVSLLTGANCAGKSTLLRMSCIAVIMAQIGCYVPARSARLTPIDRIMSRLGANDNIFAAQSTFFVELSETKKILSEATPRSLVILDELGRGTSSYDGVAVAQAVLHHVATHIGCLGFFATHYHSLATEFEDHPEIRCQRMQIHVDEAQRRITFLYKLEEGIAEGSFGMHCAAMCGIPDGVVARAETAAREWEHTSRLKESLEQAKTGCYIPLGVLSDVASVLSDKTDSEGKPEVGRTALDVLLRAIEKL
ncbi:hypothetical protein P8C59_005685 [Phyllachora maydis]|uniref:DNA mismatch repair protein n=1 Tax=Phyllachora maydis TaxID=1825666 RepID=A0AAD9I6H2_9PEZI|nr:hypothetical protein P8C59_005685 [Phyllachora maydis]